MNQRDNNPKNIAEVESNTLTQAYDETNYRATIDGSWLVIRANQYNSWLDSLLTEQYIDSWAFITGSNPYSKLLGDRENKLRNKLLKRIIEMQGLATIEAVGESRDGNWREESFLILGLNKPMALAIAAVFEQNAILYGEKGNTAEVLWVDFTTSMSPQ